jgi:hypothetical protein
MTSRAPISAFRALAGQALLRDWLDGLAERIQATSYRPSPSLRRRSRAQRFAQPIRAADGQIARIV